jgi:hypothetical protein
MPPSDPHMAGINALPRLWDPSDLSKGFKYDWRNYDDKAKAEYKKFSEARAQSDRQRQAKAKAELDAAMKQVGRTISDRIKSEVGKEKRSRGELVWLGDSTCFAELEYSREDGGVFATFAKDGSTYFYPMSRSEAAEWFEDAPSQGQFFNAEIR